MIVTDGNLFFNSKNVRAVGAYSDGTVFVYIQGINGYAQLNYNSPERACSVHMRLILEITPKKEIKDITEYLFSEAKSKGLDIELPRELLLLNNSLLLNRKK